MFLPKISLLVLFPQLCYGSDQLSHVSHLLVRVKEDILTPDEEVIEMNIRADCDSDILAINFTLPRGTKVIELTDFKKVMLWFFQYCVLILILLLVK